MTTTPDPFPPLGLDRALDDQLGAQAAELGEAVGVIEPIEEHPLEGFLDPGAGGLSFSPRRGPPLRTSRSASEPPPSSLFQRPQDATEAGRLLCHALQDEAWIVWSHPDTRILSIIRQAGTDHAAAWELWLQAGPE